MKAQTCLLVVCRHHMLGGEGNTVKTGALLVHSVQKGQAKNGDRSMQIMIAVNE